MRVYWAIPVLASILILGAVGFSQDVFADDTVCDGILTAAEGPYDNVVVNPEDSCTVEAGTTINGNFQAVEAVDIVIRGSIFIGGNVQINESTGIIRIERGTIVGDLQIQESTAVLVFITRESVGGSVQIEKHNSPSASLIVSSNVVGENIQVTETDTARVSIFRNTLTAGNISVLKNTIDGCCATILVQGNRLSGIDANIVVQENFVRATTGSAGAFIRVEGNLLTGDIHMEKNTAIAVSTFNGIARIIAQFNGFSSGNLELFDNHVVASNTDDRGAGPTAQIIVANHRTGPQNIEMTGNSATASGTVASGFFGVKAKIEVFNNDVQESVKVQKNTAQADGGSSTIIVAEVVASRNNFMSGNLQVQENEAKATGTTSDASINVDSNGLVSSPQNIEVQKNTASASDSELVTVDSNTADENIQCSENSPDPTGSSNVGNLEGQCVGL